VRVPDPILDLYDRVRPVRRLPAARRRAADSEALAGGGRLARSKLQVQRDELAREFVGLQGDLGGIAYEMASRDHFRLDVLARQAAKLQHVDSQLGQAERMLRLEQDGIGGTCPSCGGAQARGAVFCWQCGEELTPAASPTAVSAPPPAPAPPAAPTAAEAPVAPSWEQPTQQEQALR
jgi:hypothetical protein